MLRNDFLVHLAERGYRSIALETDIVAATLVDDHVTGVTNLDTAPATGFSHGFGAIPGNRELLQWLRAYNNDRSPQDRIHFHGFDAPTEYAAAPSPRRYLRAAADHLPEALRPDSASDLDTLSGADADWSNEAAMYDPAASIGDSDRARALRLIADDLAGALRRAARPLRAADPIGYDRAVTHARTAVGLLRYHATMARPAPDRIADLMAVRSEMMADNLLAIVAQEQHRGPTLVFAHNAHLQRARSGADMNRCSAGTLVAAALGERYMFLAADAAPASAPGTLHHLLAQATTRRALFPAPALRAALPRSLEPTEPVVRGHIPLTLADLSGADAVVFIADTDGKQFRYW